MHILSLLLRLLTLLLCVHNVLAIQRILYGPSNTTVRVGQTAILRCQVADQVGGVQWTRNGFGLGTDRKIPHFKRFQMSGAISKGEYNLEIENVSVDDDGSYECQISWANKDNPDQVSAPAQLSVIAEPLDPTLGDSQESIKANEDLPVRAKCVSKNGRPAARLVWVVSMDPQATRIVSYLNNASDILKEIGVMPARGQKSFEFHSQETVLDDDNGFYTIISEIDFVPQKEDDSRYLACIALHPTYEGKSRVASAALSVRYKPKVQVQLDESASDLREGGRAVFRCMIDAQPRKDLSVSWQGLEDRLKAINAQTAVVENLKMEDHLTQISCLARNSVGLTKASANLTVNFGPRLMSTPQSRVVNAGESVSFHCEAIGNPTPRISWYRAGASSKDEILAKGNTLTLDSVSMRHIGQYECIAYAKGFPPSKLTHSLHIKGPPVVQVDEPTYLSNSKIVLNCEVHSKPNANRIAWYKNDKVIDYSSVDQNRFTLREFSREFGVESRLSIDQVKSSDYGTYNCTAWNEFGSRSSTVDVVEQTFLIKAKKTAFLYVSQIPWFVWAALFGLIFLLILICCIRSCCCCCFGSKRRGCCTRGDHLKPAKFSDCSDVTVRCEALDHDPQPYFTDMFATSPPLDSSSELLHKDYISIPQNNPDLDFLPPPVYGTYYQQQPYGYNNTMEYSPNDNNGNHSTFSGYNSPIMGQDICVPVYNSNRNNFAVRQLNVAPLETLQEVDTPTGDNILLADNRAASRVSTHV